MNVALLAKLGWRMLKHPNQLCASVLWHKYGDPLSGGLRSGEMYPRCGVEFWLGAMFSRKESTGAQ